MKIYCEDCKKSLSVNVKWFNGICPSCYSSNTHDWLIYKTKDMPNEFLQKAHEIYDDDYICPKCKSLLTGLHMQSSCYHNFILKEAYKLWKEHLKKEKLK